nr:resistin [Pelodiscus sinensis]|eukprot:XP_006132103.1 resistin [Pelodiscus sinensis]
MKAAVFLLLALLVPAWHAGAQCIIDNVVDLKVQAAISSIVSTTLAKAKLLCQDVSARGALVTCPTDYKPTGCACGMGYQDFSNDASQVIFVQNRSLSKGEMCKVAL